VGLIVATAWAQTSDAAGPPPMLVQIAPLLLIGAIFYFLLVRPEQRRRKDLEAQISGLKRNDQVVLSGGIHGRVTALGDKILSIEIAPKVAVQVDRDAVQRVLTAAVGETREKEREKS
jgi:preprotein translocase subunit YajC